METKKLEYGIAMKLDFCKQMRTALSCPNVLPVVVQDRKSKEVLFQAYVNREALKQTLEKRIAVFWSTSKNCLWVKGETSGCVLAIKDIKVNCENSSLLYLVEMPLGKGACHVTDKNGKYYHSCYYRSIDELSNK